jgi:hypothetical protein
MLGLGLGSGTMAYHDSINGPYNSLKSLSFGGTDEYVTVPDHINYTPNAGLAVGGAGSDRGFSVSTWVKFPSSPNTMRIIGKDSVYPHNGYEWTSTTNFAGKARIAFFSTPNTLATDFYQATAVSFVFSTDTWYHIVWTWNLDSNTASNTTTGDIKLYIDGVNTAVDIAKFGTFDYVKDGGKNLAFAKFTSTYSVIKLDEVAIFDDNLSQSKVTEYYNLGKPIDLAGQDFLHGYWRMGDGDSNAADGIIDSSTYANHGTMTNMEAEDIVTDAP